MNPRISMRLVVPHLLGSPASQRLLGSFAPASQRLLDARMPSSQWLRRSPALRLGNGCGTEYLDASAAVVASIAYLLITICMSSRLNPLKQAFLNNINVTVQILLTASMVLYVCAGTGGTFAYEQFLIGLSMTYMVMTSCIFISGD